MRRRPTRSGWLSRQLLCLFMLFLVCCIAGMRWAFDKQQEQELRAVVAGGVQQPSSPGTGVVVDGTARGRDGNNSVAPAPFHRPRYFAEMVKEWSRSKELVERHAGRRWRAIYLPRDAAALVPREIRREAQNAMKRFRGRIKPDGRTASRYGRADGGHSSGALVHADYLVSNALSSGHGHGRSRFMLYRRLSKFIRENTPRVGKSSRGGHIVIDVGGSFVFNARWTSRVKAAESYRCTAASAVRNDVQYPFSFMELGPAASRIPIIFVTGTREDEDSTDNPCTRVQATYTTNQYLFCRRGVTGRRKAQDDITTSSFNASSVVANHNSGEAAVFRMCANRQVVFTPSLLTRDRGANDSATNWTGVGHTRSRLHAFERIQIITLLGLRRALLAGSGASTGADEDDDPMDLDVSRRRSRRRRQQPGSAIPRAFLLSVSQQHLSDTPATISAVAPLLLDQLVDVIVLPYAPLKWERAVAEGFGESLNNTVGTGSTGPVPPAAGTLFLDLLISRGYRLYYYGVYKETLSGSYPPAMTFPSHFVSGSYSTDALTEALMRHGPELGDDAAAEEHVSSKVYWDNLLKSRRVCRGVPGKFATTDQNEDTQCWDRLAYATDIIAFRRGSSLAMQLQHALLNEDARLAPVLPSIGPRRPN